MEQPQYHMFHRQRFEVEYRRLYEEIGLGTTIWSPLASGLLTGKYNEGIPEDSRANLAGYEWLLRRFSSDEAKEQIAKIRQLTKLAYDIGTSMTRLALAWCLKNPNVSTVITGASRPAQVEDNMQALAVTDLLTDDVLTQIEEILNNKPEIPEF